MKSLLHAARVGAGAALNSLVSRSLTQDDTRFSDAIGQIMHIPGWFTDTNAAAFWAVMRERRPRTVVEIGSYLGRSTVFLGCAMKTLCPPDARLISIDPHTGDRQQLEGVGLASMSTLEMFRFNIHGAGLSDLVDIRVATSDEVATDWTDEVDLLFVDGWHSYDAVRGDIANWVPHLARRGLACFDDFGTYEEVYRAVMDGCADERLAIYGTVLGQAWAGRDPEPPRGLRRGLRYARLRPVRPAA